MEPQTPVAIFANSTPLNGVKTCTRCKETKPEDERYFPKNQDGKRGFRSQCKICTNATNRETQRRNKHKYVPAKRENWLRRNYGIGTADYDAMLAAQNGRCAICRADSPMRRRQGYFSVDHDHGTGVVRGLLCKNCNTLVGLLECVGVPRVIADRAVEYIDEGQKRQKHDRLDGRRGRTPNPRRAGTRTKTSPQG